MSLIEVAKFPAQVATETDMLNWQNVVPSGSGFTLSAQLSSSTSSGSFTLNADPGSQMPADNFEVSIDDEIIFITTRSTTTCNFTSRGAEGTTASTHASGTAVQLRVTAKSHNQVVSEIKAIETALGASMANVANNPATANQNMKTYAVCVELPNDTTTGTVLNKLCKITSTGKAVVTGATDSRHFSGVVVSGAGTTGNCVVAVSGIVSLVFDGATTGGNFVLMSGANAGQVRDAGSNTNTTTDQSYVGKVLSTNAAAGTYQVLLKPEPGAMQVDKANTFTSGGSIDMSSSASPLYVPSGNISNISAGSIVYNTLQKTWRVGADLGGSTTTAAGFLPRFLSFGGAATQLDAGTTGLTETAFSTTYTIPAAYFIVGKVLLLFVTMQEVTTGAAVSRKTQVRLQSGGSTNVYAYTPAASTPSNSATRNHSFIIMLQCLTTGATGTLEVSVIGQGSAAASVVVNQVVSPITIDTTVAQVVQTTQTFGVGTAGEKSQLRSLMVGEVQ